jgi:hypothetical protein
MVGHVVADRDELAVDVACVGRLHLTGAHRQHGLVEHGHAVGYPPKSHQSDAFADEAHRAEGRVLEQIGDGLDVSRPLDGTVEIAAGQCLVDVHQQHVAVRHGVRFVADETAGAPDPASAR